MSEQDQNKPVTMGALKLGVQAILDTAEADGDAAEKYYVKAQPVIASGPMDLEEYKTFLRKFIQAIGCFKEDLLTICPIAMGIINPTVEEYQKKDAAFAEKISDNYNTKLSLREGTSNGQVQTATPNQTQAVKKDSEDQKQIGDLKS
jgi:hypothetical protein